MFNFFKSKQPQETQQQLIARIIAERQQHREHEKAVHREWAFSEFARFFKQTFHVSCAYKSIHKLTYELVTTTCTCGEHKEYTIKVVIQQEPRSYVHKLEYKAKNEYDVNRVMYQLFEACSNPHFKINW